MKIAIIGDVHGFWAKSDTDYFNASDYDYILFTGDLSSYKETEDMVAKRISELRKPCLMIPGNVDTSSLFQLAGEFLHNNFFRQMSQEKQKKRLKKMKEALGETKLCAYESRILKKSSMSINLIVLRPFAMGVTLSFTPILKKLFGIASIQDCKEKIAQLIDSSKEEYVLFLGHNGPFGLGSNPSDPWSSDFTKVPVDYGDSDYRFAIDYAKSKGKKVLAAIAGHMHHKVKGTEIERNWSQEIAGTHYINAAKVPRIFKKGDKILHHYIQIKISNSMVLTIKEIFFK